MSFSRRFARGLLAFACAVLPPITLAAQSGPTSATVPVSALAEQQRMGEALFLKYCPLCHAPMKKRSKDPNEQGVPREASLAGLFRKERTQEASVRQIIQQGIPKKMPGFQYTLGPKELDDLISYLKTL
jgi:mono/diheme cytochrome c family protein